MECTKEEVRKERKGEDNVFQLGKLIDEISSFSQRSSLSDLNQAESGKVVPHICLVGEILQGELPSDTRAQQRRKRRNGCIGNGHYARSSFADLTWPSPCAWFQSNVGG